MPSATGAGYNAINFLSLRELETAAILEQRTAVRSQCLTKR